ncbi:MAG: YwiC-like family protein [Ardenticatenales bacterium]|nr:YwiC-like family protein [Ardenticatenales bacterium]
MTTKPIFVKRLIIPSEHGAWVWLFVPYVVGLLVAPRLAGPTTHAGLAAMLVGLGGLSAFLLRQPATAWMRMRQGRGNLALAPLAAGWTAGLAFLALLCFLGLLLLGRTALFSLMGVGGGIFLLYLYAARRGRAGMRALWMEAAGAAGLSMMAPAAVIAVSGQMLPAAWTLWGVLATQNVLAVLYVRLRLADTKGRPVARRMVMVTHAAGVLLVSGAGILGWTPLLIVVPFLAFMLRAWWAAAHPRPVPNVRRFGFLELAVAALAGCWFIFSYF